MPTPRPTKVRQWTQADHVENSRRIQRDADRRTWERLGRLIGIRGRDLSAALGRMLDDRIAAALRTHNPSLLEQLKAPTDAEALRGTLMDVLADDIAEVVLILTNQEGQNERIDKEEIAGRGESDATFEQREIYPPEWEDTQAQDA